MVEITLDGEKVTVPEGSMVMHAAEKLKRYVPHFCYHKKLSIAANCRMCLVDVEKAPKPLPACATPVTAGMVVHTRSEKAIKAQKGVMEFLLINHPLDCPICDQGGECQLQDLAVGYGGSESRYTEEKRVVFHKDLGPLVGAEEMSRCIHCTRCVRFGQEIAGVMELGMLNRGEHSEITSFLGRTVDSELSGNMIDICPVGALTSKPFRYTARTWELARRQSISPHDGLGSNLIVQVKNNQVMRVVPLENESINECWLSDRDRFSYQGLNSEDRLTQPLIRDEQGNWKEVDWSQALERVAAQLTEIKAHAGPEQIAALTTSYASLEEFTLLEKLVRGLDSDNIDFRLQQTDFSTDGALKGIPWLGLPIGDIAQLDSVLLIGSFLRKEHPLLAQRLRQASKKGTRVSSVQVVDDELLMPIDHKIVVCPSKLLNALAEIANAIAKVKNLTIPTSFIKLDPSDAAVKIAQSLSEGEKKVVWLGNYAESYSQAGQLLVYAQWIAQATGATLGHLISGANTLGGYLAKALPQHQGLNARAMFEHPRQAYIVMHAEPELDCADPVRVRKAFEQASFNVALTSYKSAASSWAHVMLPIAPFTETSGSFINAEGRLQCFNGTVRPLGETRPAWKVLRVLGNLLNLPGFDYETSEQVRKELLEKLDLTGDKAIDTLTSGIVSLDKLNSFLNSAINLNADGSILSSVVSDPAKADAVTINNSNQLERIADVGIYHKDAIVRRAPALQKTTDGQVPAVRLHPETITELNLKAGDLVLVSSDQGQVKLNLIADNRVPLGSVRIPSAHPDTAALGYGHAKVNLTGITTGAQI